MCRHAAYLGEPVALAELMVTGGHSLEHQSYAPRELLSGVVCADGFGVGWHSGATQIPPRYRRELPIWADPDLAPLAQSVRASSIVAAVRNATPGMAGGLAAVHPFALDGVLFSHNGAIAGFAGLARALSDELPDELFAEVTCGTDSELLFLSMIARRRAGADLATAVAAAICDLMARAPGSRLNVLASDGTSLVATRAGAGTQADSLYLLDRAGRVPRGAVLASEPFDDDRAWQPVEAGSLVQVDHDGQVVITQPLTALEATR